MSTPAKKIGAFDAKTRLPELLRAVRRGQRFTITHRGKPVATLAPPTPEQAGKVDKNGWPVGYWEKFAGSIPDLKRWPQGEFEKRDPIE